MKKVEFESMDYDPSKPPPYLPLLAKQSGKTVTTVEEAYKETIAYLEPTGCLHMIPSLLIREYVMANYHAAQAHYELSQSGHVCKNHKDEVVISKYAEFMQKQQKQAMEIWDRIWAIVSRNSERDITGDPKYDMMSMLLGGRARKQRKKKEDGVHG